MPAAPMALTLAVRQDGQVVTQTIERAYTTLTTIVTLGSDYTAATSSIAAPIETDTGDEVRAGHNGLTDVHIGAMVGAIVGFVLIVLALIFCITSRRRHRDIRVGYEYYTQTYSHSGSPSSSSGSGTPPVVVMGEKAHVKRPKKAKTHHRHRNEPPEHIPGGPKYPTYRAIPIPNPRTNPNPPRV